MENKEYLTTQLITYIGNKRSLLDFINLGLIQVKKDLNKQKLSLFDVFSGSGVVSRFFKQHADFILANDLETYARIINYCYLSNKSEIPMDDLTTEFISIKSRLDNEFLQSNDTSQIANCEPFSSDTNLNIGFIEELYAPKDINSIQTGERCFFTPRNARYIDKSRLLIGNLPQMIQPYLLAPLLAESSIHSNTSGVFKGFYKNSQTGKGQFGGNGKDALSRIYGDITLKMPVFSNYECSFQIMQEDAQIAAEKAPEVDLAYLDPPYNQHPYGANYFMLNLIAENIRPTKTSDISGIPVDWNRSIFNKKAKIEAAFAKLVNSIKAKYLLISFNSDGFIRKEKMLEILNNIGKITVLETDYNTFRGCRNLSKRSIYTKEYLYLVKKF